MIRETRNKRVPIVQVEVYGLAEPDDGASNVEYVSHGTSHRGLDVCDQVGQSRIVRMKVPEAQIRMAMHEPGCRLPDADMADVKAATDTLSVLKPFRQLGEPGWLQADSVLKEDDRAVHPRPKAPIKLAHDGKQTVRLCLHLTAVMDDHTPEPACEPVGEFRDNGAPTLMQHIDATVQVDDRQIGMGRHELQNMLKLFWRVGVHLCGQAHLSEAKPSELEQRIVTRDAPLEQGMHRAERPLVLIYFGHGDLRDSYDRARA
jgi:hypothetical protein